LANYALIIIDMAILLHFSFYAASFLSCSNNLAA
jgi:hypothetical protein